MSKTSRETDNDHQIEETEDDDASSQPVPLPVVASLAVVLSSSSNSSSEASSSPHVKKRRNTKSNFFDRPPEEHQKVKVSILKRYLQAWFPILGQTPYYAGELVVFDTFAGPGKYNDGTLGSPLVALDCFLECLRSGKFKHISHVYFFFAEPKKGIRSKLVTSLEAYTKLPQYILLTDEKRRKSRDVTFSICVSQDCFDAEFFGPLLTKVKENEVASFAFIDPFGYSQTPMNVVQTFLEGAKSEVLINFMGGAVVRALRREFLAPKLDLLFGNSNWKNARNGPDWEKMTPVWRRNKLANEYEVSLKKKAQYVCRFAMRTGRNRHLYHLIFATHHEKGLKQMKDAMIKFNGVGDSQDDMAFSDYTFAKMKDFDKKKWVDYCAQQVKNQFSGTCVKKDTIRKFVLFETAWPWRPNFLFEKLLESGIGSKKRPNDDDKIKFPVVVGNMEIVEEVQFADEDLDSLLATYGLYIEQIPKDGNCLFSSLAYLLGENEQETVRNIVHDTYESNEELRSRLVRTYGAEEAYDALSKLVQDGEWGGEEVIVAIAQLYVRNVVIVSEETGHVAHVYRATGGHLSPSNPENDLDHYLGQQYNPVALLYSNGNHYDALIARAGGSNNSQHNNRSSTGNREKDNDDDNDDD